MSSEDRGINRRRFVKQAAAASVTAFSARGIYDLVESLAGGRLNRADAAGANVGRRQEQYIVDNVQAIIDNGVSLFIPPLHNDVFTAKLARNVNWTTSVVKNAQSRLENSLSQVEKPYTSNASGLTMVIGWGLPYFRNRLPSQVWQANLPIDTALSKSSGTTQYAVLDAIRFPSDPADMLLEDNEVMFKIRSDSDSIVKGVERALFDDPNSGAYVGDLFNLTSKRIGFLGRGFGFTDVQTPGPSIAKAMAVRAGVPGSNLIPDKTQLMLGFTSTQTAALGPDIIPSFETLPGVTNQFPNGYFANGCAMHLSHLFLDLVRWYGFDYSTRVARMFSPHTQQPGDQTTVTIPNGPESVSTKDQLLADASKGLLGHNETLQQATRLSSSLYDNYHVWRTKGTAVPLREDFNTIDNPFFWTSDPVSDRWNGTTAAAGLHFVAFIPASSKFHAARMSMDGVLPDGTNLKELYGINSDANGINAPIMSASHRQNYLIPPRRHRSFPLAELLK